MVLFGIAGITRDVVQILSWTFFLSDTGLAQSGGGGPLHVLVHWNPDI